MAEIYAQVLEANDFTVERQLEIGPRTTTFPALQAGDFDMMPEYIGSTLEFLVKEAGDEPGEASNDAAATAQALQTRLDGEEMTALAYTEAVDTNAFVVRQDTADELSLSTMSDLAEVQGDLAWGLPPECITNPLCGDALMDAYGIEEETIEGATELDACSAPMATALDDGGIDVAELCSTQPDIERFGFVVLEDDQGTQPADALAPLFRNDALEAAGGAEALAAILDPVSEAMTTDALIALNVRVGLDQEDYDMVATDWLTEEGLLP
jgi:osmoprotectant transport system substrate-binding protein